MQIKFIQQIISVLASLGCLGATIFTLNDGKMGATAAFFIGFAFFAWIFLLISKEKDC
jgi:hypothetical protein